MAGLNLRRRFVIPRPPPVPPVPPVPATASGPTDGTSSGGGLSGNAMIGAIVGACAGFAVLTALVAGLVVWRARRRRRMFGQAQAPGVGPDTTLVVTDVEGSTTLWYVVLRGPQTWPPAAQGHDAQRRLASALRDRRETLPQELMNQVLDMHHKLMRKVLLQHGGYESDTEGDSFIVAFASPWDALAFAQVRGPGPARSSLPPCCAFLSKLPLPIPPAHHSSP